MKHFVLSAPPGPGGVIRLSGNDYHYLVRVRRLRAGMFFNVCLPGGTAAKVRILSTDSDVLTGECQGMDSVQANFQPAAQRPPVIALFQGLTKGQKMDLIIRQAAEAEAAFIVPAISEYSSGGTESAGKLPVKMKRWERIIREARQQSGSSVETKLVPPCGIEDLFVFWDSLKKEYNNPLGILFHQEPLEKASLHGYLGSSPDITALAVGPEGGFSPKELSLFLAAGFKPLLMGNSVLRTETAALYGIAAVRTILLESENWIPLRKESDS